MSEESTSLPCQDKAAYPNKKAAQGAATVAYYQHNTAVKPYRCQHCDLWHLASKYAQQP